MNYSLLIIDDEKHAITLLQNYINESNLNLELLPACRNVREAIDSINKNKPNIVLLDIKLRNETSFDILSQIDHQPKVIFTTAYDGYAIQAIKNDAVDYVMKPIEKKELISAIQKAISQNNRGKLDSMVEFDFYQRRLKFPAGELIAISDIVYCKAEGNYSHVYLSDDRKLLIAKTLKKLEIEIASKAFVRTHQSHLINLTYVESIYSQSVSLKGFKDIPIARGKRQLFEKILK
ncbi:LytR/AlgR family response regulator transcription factor [Parvicella tangerina]|uniref:Transcriptional regulatory protein BtsR n=1 Tax=Parvicella tangerina TaxID=2829795 RepID=A0A916N9H9_9FLAO|nr:LytTR family DNA-binding domain-containing protein [Parvicella tangerina]CAG5077220.1 Transcriptional regulatory protein BtsR [Parvicella tangerina]